MELQRFQPGFRTSALLCLEVELPSSRYNESRQIAFFDDLSTRLRRIPGVSSVGLSWQLPLRRSVGTTVYTVEGQPASSSGEVPMAAHRVVNSGFFPTFAIRLERGRYIEDSDGPESTGIAVISRALAEQAWPGQDPIGRRIKLARPEQQARWLHIAGVVADVRNNWFGPDLRPTIYVPARQAPERHMSIAIAAQGNPLLLAGVARREIAGLDRDLPVYNISSIEEVVAESFWRNRMFAVLFGFFAVVALVLATAGLYAVVSYSVVQRVQEIGLRMALGATPRDILRLVVGEGMRVAIGGTMIGLLAALATTRLLSGLLFGIAAADPLTFSILAVMLPAVSLAASYLPAMRAMRVSPVDALRS
jgi:putative ABC transport system permease protein